MNYFWPLVLGVALTASANEPPCAIGRPGPAFDPGCQVNPGQPNPGNQPSCQFPRCRPPCEVTPPRSGSPTEEEVPREGPPAAEYATQETGFYQAPPRTGAVQGPSRGIGFNFGAITLPEMRLRMPTIELPSCYRVHQHAKMLVDSAHAPWVSTGVETVSVGPTAGRSYYGGYPTNDRSLEQPREAPTAAEPRDAPPEPREASCQQLAREYEGRIQELQRKIEDCERLKRSIEDSIRDYGERSQPDPNGTDTGVPQKRSIQAPRLPLPEPPVPEPDTSRRPAPPHAVRAASFEGATSREPRRLPTIQDATRLYPPMSPAMRLPAPRQ